VVNFGEELVGSLGTSFSAFREETVVENGTVAVQYDKNKRIRFL